MGKTLLFFKESILYPNGMKPTISLYFDRIDGEDANLFAKALEEAGYPCVSNPPSFDGQGLAAILLSDQTSLEGLYASAPWLKDQYEYSSFPHLSLLPVFVYASSKTDPEEAFEGKVGELYEELMSGEFKPFGFDKDNKNPLAEFQRILEGYLE